MDDDLGGVGPEAPRDTQGGEGPGGRRAGAPEAGSDRPEGRIVLVGTPIGNLGDFSPRAAQALADADVIFCEDTRHTRKLLTASGITSRRLVALHQHNEEAAASRAVHLAGEGGNVALVSDAGMPGISDPGERLVRMAIAAGVVVEVVPGPSAVIAALVVSGLSTERFCFEGFLPRKGAERAGRLAAIATETRTTVLYESPHRVHRTLAELLELCGADRPVALVREITKRFEETWRGPLSEGVEWTAGGEARGEWVVVVAGAVALPVDDRLILEALAGRQAAGSEGRQAVEEVSALLGVARNRVYRLALGGTEGSDRSPR